MVEQIFLNVMESISANRHWLMPILLLLVLATLVHEVAMVLSDPDRRRK